MQTQTAAACSAGGDGVQRRQENLVVFPLRREFWRLLGVAQHQTEADDRALVVWTVGW